MLDPTELARVADQFGVDDRQVQRDHLISHVLAALSVIAPKRLIFFGGTAISRTVLPNGRLSEDIDLIAVDNRRELATGLTAVIPQALRREFPGLTWSPSLAETRDSDPAVLRDPDGLVVRIQLLTASGYPRWPTADVDVVQRYTDAPPARLTVPTAPAFVAAKSTAWHDRAASRDLWDLWALSNDGHLTTEAAELYRKFGPTNRYPDPDSYNNSISEERWQRDLAGQVRLAVTAAQASATVRKRWAEISSEQT